MKKKISRVSRILIITECSTAIALLLLCGYKSKFAIVDDIVGKSEPDIVLDAGHGGYDSGAFYGDYYEKDINLQMIKDIGKTVEDAGYEVLYTRKDDNVDWASEESEDLKYRTDVSNASGAKLFLSLHVNSEEYDLGTSGYEAWTDPNDATAMALSQNILQEVDTLQYSENRGIQDVNRSPLHVVSNNKIPAILFEVGFIGSDNDQQYLFNDYNQKEFSNKIAEGIIKTLKDMEKK